MITTLRTNTNHPMFLSLVTELDQELDNRYGIIQLQYKELNKTENIDTAVVALFEDKPVGCGCFKKYNDTSVELKRFYVQPNHRGQGIADYLYNELEIWARQLGYNHFILETGTQQPEAIKFYTRKGFVPIENFGAYAGNNNSLCFSKTI